MLVTCWTGTVYATEIDGLYRGYFLGDIFYSEFGSEGTAVAQMEGLVYIDGVLTSVPAVCISPDIAGMYYTEYGELYTKDISRAGT